MSHLWHSTVPVDLSVDFVVVGSGAGGATAAAWLARGGRSVALVEAGAWRDPEHYPSSVFGTMRDLFDDFGTLVARGRALWPIVQGACVGGSTVINSAICVRTPDDLFATWQQQHGIADLRASVLRHQDALEQELSASPVPTASAGRSNELAMIGAQRLGYDSHVMQRYVAHCQGAGQCLQGCGTRKKQSLNLTFVPEVLARGGHVLSCARVSRVLFKGQRAVGVTGQFRHPQTKKSGARFHVWARRGVIVAASATHSPALLLRSGVRLPALGQFFRAHPGTGVFGLYDEVVDLNVGATQGWSSTAFRQSPGFKLETLAIPPEMIVSRLSGGGTALMEKLRSYRHLAMWVAATRAESVGQVRAGLFGRPAVSYALDQADMMRLRSGLSMVAKTHVAAGAKQVLPGIYGLPYALSPDEIGLIDEAPLDPRCYVAILSHLFGGCVMGQDESKSVVNARGQVHGYEGLFVADASVIPTNLGVNPQHTIMGLARTFCDALLT